MPIGWEDEKPVVVTKEDLQKILPKKKLPAELGANSVPREDLTISNYDWRDTFRNYIADPLRGFIRMPAEAIGATLGSIGGGIVGSVNPEILPITVPVGAGAGFVAGGTAMDQLWQNTAGRISPRLFGGPSPNFDESLKTSALESAADMAFVKGIPALRGLAKTKAFSKFFSPDPNVPIKSVLEQAPKDLNLTVGQATQNKLAQFVESLVVSEGKKDIRTLEQTVVKNRMADDLARSITGYNRASIPTRQELAQLSGSSAGSQYKAVHTIRRDLYNTAKEEIANSTAPGYRIEPSKPSTLIDPKTSKIFPTSTTPQLIPTSLVGPVNPARTIDFAQNTVLKDIDAFIGDPNNSNYQLPEVKSAVDALRNKVSTFVRGNLVDSKFQPVMNYETAIKDKDELNQLFKKTPYNLQTQLAETIRTMRDLISQDITDSSVNWTPEAKASLDRAKEYHIQTFNKLYGPTIAKKMASVGKFKGDPDIIEENILKMGAQNATIAEEIVNASGTKKPLASQYIKRFFDVMTNADDQMVGTSGVTFLNKTKEVAAKFLTRDQRDGMDILARTVQATTPNAKQVPMASIMFRAGYMTVSVGSGLIAGNLTGSAGAGMAVMATVPWAKGALSDMMMSSANARLAAKAARLAPGSPESTSIIKSLFKTGLRGVRFELQTATGEGLGLFEPHEDGKLHPVNEITPITSPTNVNLNLKQIGWE